MKSAVGRKIQGWIQREMCAGERKIQGWTAAGEIQGRRSAGARKIQGRMAAGGDRIQGRTAVTEIQIPGRIYDLRLCRWRRGARQVGFRAERRLLLAWLVQEYKNQRDCWGGVVVVASVRPLLSGITTRVKIILLLGGFDFVFLSTQEHELWIPQRAGSIPSAITHMTDV